MKKFLLLILATASMLAFPAWLGAQTKSVKVNVVDSYGPVAGAAIQVKGTTNGQSTDLDGNATSTNVDAQSVLVVSFIGYVTQEITVGDRSAINVTLEEEAESLEETVLVGYGTRRRNP